MTFSQWKSSIISFVFKSTFINSRPAPSTCDKKVHPRINNRIAEPGGIDLSSALEFDLKYFSFGSYSSEFNTRQGEEGGTILLISFQANLYLALIQTQFPEIQKLNKMRQIVGISFSTSCNNSRSATFGRCCLMKL